MSYLVLFFSLVLFSCSCSNTAPNSSLTPIDYSSDKFDTTFSVITVDTIINSTYIHFDVLYNLSNKDFQTVLNSDNSYFHLYALDSTGDWYIQSFSGFYEAIRYDSELTPTYLGYKIYTDVYSKHDLDQQKRDTLSLVFTLSKYYNGIYKEPKIYPNPLSFKLTTFTGNILLSR